MKCMRTYKKWICFLLLVTLKFSGLCLFEHVEDTDLLYTNTFQTNSHVLSDQESITGSDPILTEQLGLQNVSNGILEERTAQSRNCVRAIILLLSLAILPQKSRKTKEMANACDPIGKQTLYVILKYIHHKDGEKDR